MKGKPSSALTLVALVVSILLVGGPGVALADEGARVFEIDYLYWLIDRDAPGADGMGESVAEHSLAWEIFCFWLTPAR